ncbi:glycosyltransferase [Rhodocytophaga rosea]|uniref:Glycosyltransferase n=1 Tax=Rhodocytophaga rosea TaxID=2704465 RepID=A0A6C0GL85_9BACT|nr:glycosyltransferase family 2 protein [Rhodocytophaga rosea]QHT68841.1 glycosyltransferase [Rhodocytophaga rosea]
MKKKGGLRTKGILKSGDATHPLVSIITVVYNGEKHIKDTIQSVQQQTYSPIEYIIIDGGSKDNTLTIIEKHEGSIDYWVSEPDKGISDGFNKGIQACRGEIVGIINSDDWYERDAVEKIVKNIGDNDVAYGKIVYWRHNKIDKVSPANHTLLPREMSVNHMAVFVRKTAYEKWGSFDTALKYAMDYDLLLRFFLGGATYVYIDAIIANMRWGGLSDNLWISAVKEVHAIKLKNKLPKTFAWFYTLKIFLFISGSKLMNVLKIRKPYLRLKQILQAKQVDNMYEES